jgi:hypothetical protein
VMWRSGRRVDVARSWAREQFATLVSERDQLTQELAEVGANATSCGNG